MPILLLLLPSSAMPCVFVFLAEGEGADARADGRLPSSIFQEAFMIIALPQGYFPFESGCILNHFFKFRNTSNVKESWEVHCQGLQPNLARRGLNERKAAQVSSGIQEQSGEGGREGFSSGARVACS